MKNNKQKTVDMLNGPLFNKMLRFAIPIGCSSILQQMFNSVDSAVVGKFAGSEALAAVGSNGPIVSLLVNLFAGLSVGVNVVIANYIGTNNNERIKKLVNNVIPLSMIAGIFLSIIGIATSGFMHYLTHTPENVFDMAILYLKIYFLAMPFILLYNYASAILRSKGDTKRPLIALILGGIINTILNLIFVIKFDMSVAGVAIATLISNVFSAGLVFIFLCKEVEPFKIDFKLFTLKSAYLKNVILIGAPAGVQGAVFSISNISIQSTINSFGSDVMAGSAAAINFENIVYYVSSAFAATAVTFVSQNYAAKKYDRCKKIFVECLIIGSILSFLSGFFCYVFSNEILRIITDDAVVIREAVIRLKIVTLFVFVSTFYEIPGAMLRGFGHSATPAIIVVFGTCAFRLVWISTVCMLIHKIELVYAVYPISWTITAIVTTITYLLMSKKIYEV